MSSAIPRNHPSQAVRIRPSTRITSSRCSSGASRTSPRIRGSGLIAPYRAPIRITIRMPIVSAAVNAIDVSGPSNFEGCCV